MPDLIEQLQQYADAAAESVPSVHLDRVRRRRAHRARRSHIVAAAAAVIALVAGVAVVVLREDEPSMRVTTNPSPHLPQTSTTLTSEATATPGPATRTLRTFPVTAFTGAEYVVWSGEAGANDTSQRADGFAVDVRTGGVRSIPAAPIDPRSGATGVWTGSELIVCCGTGRADGYRADTRSAAAWNPATGDWRILATPPESIARSNPSSVWTDELMIVVAPGPAAATYDPAKDVWTEITAPPIAGRQPESVWTGEAMVVWDSVYGSGSVGADGVADRGWIWMPGDEQWAALPDLPPGRRTQLGSIAWTGSEVMVWGQSTADEALGVGALWQPGTTEWRPIAPSPQGPVADPYNGTPGSQSLAHADGLVLVKGLDGSGLATLPLYAYNAADDQWTTTPITVDGFHPRISLIDRRVFVPDSENPIIGDLDPLP